MKRLDSGKKIINFTPGIYKNIPYNMNTNNLNNLMKNFTKQAMAIACAGLLGFGSINAYELQDGEGLFSYSKSPSENLNVFGVGDGDNHFDIAIRIDSKLLNGAKIKGVLVPFCNTDFLENMSAWISNGLNTDNYEDCLHTPDIASKSFTFSNPNGNELGWAEVMFDTPYEVTDRDVYIGYTFWIAELNDDNYKPILISNNAGKAGRGLFLQTGRWPWQDIAGSGYDWCSNMQLILELPETAVAVNKIDDVRIPAGEVATLKIPAYRAGRDKITSVDYVLTLDNQSYEYHADVTDNGPQHMTYDPVTLEISTPRQREKGTHKYYLEVTKVNGKENTHPARKIDGNIIVTDFIPKKIPVIEESTSMGCGYCTRGWYALEVMGRWHREAEDMLAISYHTEDQMPNEPMAALGVVPFPSKGNPSFRVDRVTDPESFDPTLTTPTFGLQEAWETRKDLVPPAGITVTSNWLSDDELEVTAKVQFSQSAEDGQFKLDVGLLHDGMTGVGSLWAQSNAYAGVRGGGSEPEWEIIQNGGSPIKYLTYNDVFVAGASEDFKGLDDAINGAVKDGDIVTYTHVFKMSELKTTTGKDIIQNKNYLRPFAILLNGSNQIENAGVCKVPGYNYEHKDVAVETVEADEATVPVAYFDLMGREVNTPEAGIYIVKYSDGTSAKVVVK